LVSVVLISNVKKGFKFNKGVIYALAVGLFYGLAVVVDAFNIKHFDAISYAVIMAFLPGIILLLLNPKAVKGFGVVKNLSFLKKMGTLGFFYSGQAILYFLALAVGGKASQIGPISQAQVIVTVVLAVILLKEKDNLLKKIIAAILVTIGVILMR